MARYYEADDTAYRIMEDLIDDRFGGLRAANIKILIDAKPKIDKLTKRMTFASIKCANEIERFFTRTGQNLAGVDYIIFLSELVWELANDNDKKRILSHELRHAFIDDKGNYKTIKHDIEDFYAEIELNKDDPMWSQALSTIAMAKYEQMKEEARINK